MLSNEIRKKADQKLEEIGVPKSLLRQLREMAASATRDVAGISKVLYEVRDGYVRTYLEKLGLPTALETLWWDRMELRLT